jgi:hypothetical protein
MKKIALLSVCVGMSVLGCISEPTFSPTPAISFKEIRKFKLAGGGGVGQGDRDSVVISIDFQDGDGDMGFNPNSADTLLLPRNLRRVPNYELQWLYRQNGVFRPINVGNSFSKFFYPNLRPDNRQGPIEGTLDYSVSFVYGLVPDSLVRAFRPRRFSYRRDTLKFQIQILDRAQNRSNVIESTPIIINE